MNRDLNSVRRSVLDDMERTARMRTVAIGVAAVAEAALLSTALWLIDWEQKAQVTMFVLFALTYLVIALGLIALGTHVSRSTMRIVAAIEAASTSRA